MTKPADFHILDVVTTYTGIMLTPAKVHGIKAVLDHMTGADLKVRQLPTAAEAVRDALKTQHPWLDDIIAPRGLSAEQAVGLADYITATHPNMVPLTPTPEHWAGQPQLDEDMLDLYHLHAHSGQPIPEKE